MSKCMACDEDLIQRGRDFRVVEYMDYAVEDLYKVDIELGAELDSNDGILMVHEDCTHPIERLTP